MSRLALLTTAYALSGVAGLVYEVVWLRQFALHMGQSGGAVSSVLAAFMGGLAAGSAAGAKLGARLTPRHAAWVYAIAEGIVACSALALPLALHASLPWLSWAYRDGDPTAAYRMLRGALAFLLLAIPTTAMGATFPLIVRAAEGVDPAGVPVGRLYAFNTLGAAAGAALAGFFLIPAAGLRLTTLAGVAVSLTSAGVAIAAPSRVGNGPTVKAPTRATRPPRRLAPGALAAPLAAAGLAVSGAAALSYEVVWTRLLALSIGPTVQAFALMLVVFIAGLAAGAGIGERIARRTTAPVRAFAVSLAAAALLAFAAARAIEWVPIYVAERVAGGAFDFGGLLAAEAMAVGAVLLPMTLALGASFPLGLATAGADRGGPLAGLLYAANTCGAIAGSLLAGYVLMPQLGTQRALIVTGTASIATALLLMLTRQPRMARGSLAAACVAALLIGWTAPSASRRLLSSGAYKYSAFLRDTDLRSALEAGRLLYYEDGAGATVSVRRLAGVTSLSIDGKIDASDGGDMLTQKLLAHLPLLMHPHPRDVAIIGLGSGVTLGAALVHPAERVDTIEISREVVDAAAFFSDVHGDALRDARSRLVLGDGRVHLALGRRQYDVIVSEPSNPWMAGIAALFTREFFTQARERLKPGGVLCQWTHTYDMRPEDLKSIVGTFSSVFPGVSMWLVGQGDLLLIGSTETLDGRIPDLAANWAARPQVAADLARVDVTRPFSLLSLLLGTSELARAYAAGAIPQTDDHAPLEFSAPRALYAATRPDVLGDLVGLAERVGVPEPVRAAREHATAADWRDRGRMLLRADAFDVASVAFTRALGLDADDEASVTGAIDAAGPLRSGAEVRRALEALASSHPEARAPRLGLSRLLAASGAFAEAAARAKEVVAIDGADPRGWEQLASVAADAGNADLLGSVVDELAARFPDRPLTLYFRGALAFLSGDLREALRLGRLAVERRPGLARAHALVGAASATLGDLDTAAAAFQRAIDADPTDASNYLNLGRLERQRGDLSRAREQLAEALVVAPGHPDAVQELADILDRLGQRDRAARLRTSSASPR